MADKNVVKFRRAKDKQKDDVLEFLDKLDMEKGGFIMIYTPNLEDTNTDFMAISSYTGAGIQEILALQVLEQHLIQEQFELEIE